MTDTPPPVESVPQTGGRPRWASNAAKVVRPVFVDRVERDHRQTDAEFLY